MAEQQLQLQQLTPDEIRFTNAFNAHRSTLTAFARCHNRQQLHVVRDGFFLALSSDLCPLEYEPVRNRVVIDPIVANAAAAASSAEAPDSNAGDDDAGDNNGGSQPSSDDALTRTVESARKSPAWDNLIRAVKAKAYEVGSDLDEIWMTLENGRLEWLNAAAHAHGMKTTLKAALENECGDGIPTEGDTSDAMMIWMYCLSLNIPSLERERVAWQRVVKMVDPTRPLVGYRAELWDARREEWRPLDLGVQAAAERGGSSIQEAWKA